MENKEIYIDIYKLYERTNKLLKLEDILSVKIDKVYKFSKKLKTKNAMQGLAILGLLYGCYALNEKINKLNAKVIALETEKDILDLEKGIESEKE